MTAKAVGNRGAYINGPRGVGANYYPDGSIGQVTVVGKTGDVAYFSASEIHSLDKVHRGYFFQSKAGATVEFTLANLGLAKNPKPEVQSTVPWSGSITVANDGTIISYLDAFSCLKVTFTGDGELYIVAR